MSGQQNKQFEDEIDLIDLLASLWKGKWIIIVCTLLALIGGLAYYLITPTELKGRVDLRLPNYTEKTWLNEFNRLTGINDVSGVYIDILSDESFFDQFSNRFFNKDNETNENLDDKSIKFKFETNTDEDGTLLNYTLSLFSKALTRQELIGFTERFLEEVQLTAKNNIIEYLQASSEFYKENIARKLSLLNLQKQSAIIRYEEQLRADIVKLEEEIAIASETTKADLQANALQLNEQIAIARRLNISRPRQEILPSPSETIAIQNLIESGEQPLFMRGYIALEEELRSIQENPDLSLMSSKLRRLKVQMASLKERKEVEAFVPGLADLNSQIFELKNDLTIQAYVKLLEKMSSPEFSPEFLIQTSSIENSIKQTAPRKIIIILALFAGGFLGIVLVFIRSIYQAVQKRIKQTS